MTHSEIIKKAQQGDREAAAKLFARSHAVALRFAHRLSGDYEQAEDIVQEATVQCFAKLSRFNPKGPARFETWYLAFVRNCWREQRRNRHEPLSVDDPETGVEPSEEPADIETQVDVEHCLDRLPSDQQVAIHLHYFNARSCEEIADLQSVAVGTVKARLFHARNNLRNCLEGYGNQIAPDGQ